VASTNPYVQNMGDFIRQPAVAGTFYPLDASELQTSLSTYLDQAASHIPPATSAPKAIIVPHAGYIYSAPIAASAYARLRSVRQRIKYVVLLGPSHRVRLRGLASSSATHFLSPLGPVPLQRALIGKIESLPQVQQLDAAHAEEHSLEVHLPFLQMILEDFSLIPLVVGDAAPAEVAEVLEMLWGGDETLIVISSDLSHYLNYESAQRRDRATSDAIERLDAAAIQYEDACGRNPVNGLLNVAKSHHLHAHTIDLRNSGDTAGPADRVVGYGAYVFE